jgi:glucosamine--fructose-6-phosphate aminotransferase (isomerizing)
MSRMLEEIEEQPALWRERRLSLFEQASRVPKPKFVVFAARGSSDHACLYARYLFEAHLGIPCSLSAPSVVTRYAGSPKYPDGTLLIGVSQSAAAPDVAAVLEEARRRGSDTLSITNVEQGAVVSAAERQIFLGAGEERAVAATKTFTLTLLAFYEMARAWGADLAIPPDDWDLPTPADVAPFAAAVANAALVFTLGRGYHFSVALEAALKLMECALLPAKPYSIADFAHGPIALVGEGTVAVVFGSDAEDGTAEEVRRKVVAASGWLLQAPVASSLPEELRVLPASVFAQRLAWQVAQVRGLDPDQPRNLSKVTRTR